LNEYVRSLDARVVYRGHGEATVKDIQIKAIILKNGNSRFGTLAF